MYSTLINITPKVNENFTILLQLNNKAQEEYFNQKVKPQLIGYLQTELQNDLIDIKVDISDEVNTNNKSKVYTAEDKFKHLTEKNPNLNKLKQQFNLDFE